MGTFPVVMLEEGLCDLTYFLEGARTIHL